MCILSLIEKTEIESEESEWTAFIQNASLQCRAHEAPVNLPLLAILLYADSRLKLDRVERVFCSMRQAGIDFNQSVRVSEKLSALLLRYFASITKRTRKGPPETNQSRLLGSRVVEFFAESGLQEVTPLFLACFINDFELI